MLALSVYLGKGLWRAHDLGVALCLSETEWNSQWRDPCSALDTTNPTALDPCRLHAAADPSLQPRHVNA